MQLATQSLEQMMRDLSIAYAAREVAHRTGRIDDTQDIDAAFDARAREFQRVIQRAGVNPRAIMEAAHA